MLDDVLHNQCVKVMDVDQVMAEEVDQVMAEVEVETVQLETNTRKEVVDVHHMEDRVATVRRSGNLTLKDKD